MSHEKQIVARERFTRAGVSVWNKLKRLSIVSIAFIVPLSLPGPVYNQQPLSPPATPAKLVPPAQARYRSPSSSGEALRRLILPAHGRRSISPIALRRAR